MLSKNICTYTHAHARTHTHTHTHIHADMNTQYKGIHVYVSTYIN